MSNFYKLNLDLSKKNKDIKFILKDKLGGVLSQRNNLCWMPKKEAEFFIIRSKQEINHKEIVQSYHTRKKIEEIFGFAKSNNNILPLRGA